MLLESEEVANIILHKHQLDMLCFNFGICYRVCFHYQQCLCTHGLAYFVNPDTSY